MNLDSVKQALLAAHNGGALLDTTDLPVLTEENAYQLQQAIYQQNGPSRYWKTGLLSDGSVFTAPIAEQISQHSPGQFDGNQFNALHVEAELAYRFNRSFSAGQQYSEQEVFAALDQVAVSIEVLDSRLSDWLNANELYHLADNQMNGALVIGSGHGEWQSIDMASQRVELYINDERVFADQGSHPQQDPTVLLAGFVNQCSLRGYDLAEGSWLTTGTWSGYPTAQSGDRVRAIFPGVGEAQLQL